MVTMVLKYPRWARRQSCTSVGESVHLQRESSRYMQYKLPLPPHGDGKDMLDGG